MRILPFLLLLPTVAVPATAQGIAVAVACDGNCTSPGTLGRTLVAESVRISAHLDRGVARTYADHVIRNVSEDVVDAAFFVPVPRGATLFTVSVFEGERLERYNQWSTPEETRAVLDSVRRAWPNAGVDVLERYDLVHVRIPSIPARGTQGVQFGFTQPIPQDGAERVYDYPLDVGATRVPIGNLSFVMEIVTESGFEALSSPTHPVQVEFGTELGPCPPEARCGWTGVPSTRVKIVRYHAVGETRARHLQVRYTPTPAQ